MLRDGRVVRLRTRPPGRVAGDRRTATGTGGPRTPGTGGGAGLQLPTPGRTPDRHTPAVHRRVAGRPTGTLSTTASPTTIAAPTIS